MKQQFIIETSLPTLNQIIDANRTNIYAGAKQKKKYTGIVAKSCITQGVNKLETPINVKITWYCKNRRKDKDNIMAGQKFILDGLQKAGIIKNDGWNDINELEHKFKLSTTDFIEVELEEMRETNSGADSN